MSIFKLSSICLLLSFPRFAVTREYVIRHYTVVQRIGLSGKAKGDVPDVQFTCFRDSVAAVSFRSFVFHSGERAEREKAWAKRLFKLQVPVEKCLYTWITRGACVYIRKCVLHRRVSPAADERPNNNKRQRENAEPRPRLRLENQTGPLFRGTRPISFPFIRDFLPAPRSFFFTRRIHKQDNSIYNYASSINCHSQNFCFYIATLYQEECCLLIQRN